MDVELHSAKQMPPFDFSVITYVQLKSEKNKLRDIYIYICL